MSYEITNFSADVIERSRKIPVLVDFWADWCAPCRILGPVLERLAIEQKDKWALAKVDTEAHPDLAAQFGIRSIPNVKLFVDGKVRDEFMGALPEKMIREWLDRAMPGRFDGELATARELVREERHAEALPILEEINRGGDADPEARVLLAGLLIDQEPERIPALLDGIEEDSSLFPAADALTTLLELRKKSEAPASLPDDPAKEEYLSALGAAGRKEYTRALELFIKVIRKNRYYDNDGARRACVAIFRLLGEDHEITRGYRRDFAGALNI